MGKSGQIKGAPLIFIFPEGSYSNHIDANVQNLDIAPTPLDYLDINIPDWMSGQSLISGSFQSYPVISFSGTSEQKESDPLSGNPPFYQFDKISIIDCHKNYGLNLETYDWSMSEIEDYKNKCSEEDLLTPEQINIIIINWLTQDGFQFPEILPPTKIINNN